MLFFYQFGSVDAVFLICLVPSVVCSFHSVRFSILSVGLGFERKPETDQYNRFLENKNPVMLVFYRFIRFFIGSVPSMVCSVLSVWFIDLVFLSPRYSAFYQTGSFSSVRSIRFYVRFGFQFMFL